MAVFLPPNLFTVSCVLTGDTLDDLLFTMVLNVLIQFQGIISNLFWKSKAYENLFICILKNVDLTSVLNSICILKSLRSTKIYFLWFQSVDWDWQLNILHVNQIIRKIVQKQNIYYSTWLNFCNVFPEKFNIWVLLTDFTDAGCNEILNS